MHSYGAKSEYPRRPGRVLFEFSSSLRESAVQLVRAYHASASTSPITEVSVSSSESSGSGLILRENPKLLSDVYRISVNDGETVEGSVRAHLLLALGPESLLQGFEGSVVYEPVYQLRGIWIDPREESRARVCGLLTISPISVIQLHLEKILKMYEIHPQLLVTESTPGIASGEEQLHTGEDSSAGVSASGSQLSLSTLSDTEKRRESPVISLPLPESDETCSGASPGKTDDMRGSIESMRRMMKRKRDVDKKLASALESILSEAENKYGKLDAFRYEQCGKLFPGSDGESDSESGPGDLPAWVQNLMKNSCNSLPPGRLLPIYSRGDAESMQELVRIDPITIELGEDLVPLADLAMGAPLVFQTARVRKDLALLLGLLLPDIKITDCPGIPRNAYYIRLKGIRITGGEIHLNRFLVLGNEEVLGTFPGIRTAEYLGIHQGVWVEESWRDKAVQENCVVLDASCVIGTKLLETISLYARDFLGRQEVSMMLDSVRRTHPALVQELFPDPLNPGLLKTILQNLLEEKVPIRDLVTILEAIADTISETRDPAIITERVRTALARVICCNSMDPLRTIHCLVLSDDLESYLNNLDNELNLVSSIFPDQKMREDFYGKLEIEIARSYQRGVIPVFMVSPRIRPGFSRLVRVRFPNMIVLSTGEITPEVLINRIGTITL